MKTRRVFAPVVACSFSSRTGRWGETMAKLASAAGMWLGAATILDAQAGAQTVASVRVAGGAGTANQLNLPVYVTAAPGDHTRLFIVEQRGRIRILDLTTNPPSVLATSFLDIDALVVNLSSSGDERGLLGLAFHPDFASNGYFFVNYINNASATTIARYTVTPPTSNVANAASAVTLKVISQPFANHNGGCVQFGPDGYLYVGTGDGGNACDPSGNAPNTGTLLGKMLRLDVNNPPTYVPASNPYVGPGNPLDEIWSIGLRNPWRFSFDRANGDLYIADVGQGAREEVNYIPAGSTGGENYGWDCCEGNIVLTAGMNCDGPSAGCAINCAVSSGSYVAPIHTYTHGTGISVTGGYAYRGCAIPAFDGHYFFADFGFATIWSFKVVSGTLTALTNRTAQLAPGGGLSIASVASFGEDADGEMYIVDRGGFTSATGEVYKIVPAPVAPPAPPVVTMHPADQNAAVGATAHFTVEACGAQTYQWRKGRANLSNRGAISGVNTNTLTIDPVVESDAGSYDVLVSNAYGATTSNPAVLMVPQSCPADVTLDQNVNVNDLLTVINAWGPCPGPGACPADITGDGQINVNDLLAVINSWGPCP